ncbi:MAG: hypothetical protein WA971_12125, partial [Microbacterium sp.]
HRRGRQVVLVDIENLAGGSDASQHEYAEVWALLRHGAIALHPGDVVAVGASRRAAQQAIPALWGQPVQWRWRDGVDGADLALLDFMDVTHIAQRYSRLVIASGDHAFATLAQGARRRGMAVHQVIGRGLSSAELWGECTTHAKLRLGDRVPLALAA